MSNHWLCSRIPFMCFWTGDIKAITLLSSNSGISPSTVQRYQPFSVGKVLMFLLKRVPTVRDLKYPFVARLISGHDLLCTQVLIEARLDKSATKLPQLIQYVLLASDSWHVALMSVYVHLHSRNIKYCPVNELILIKHSIAVLLIKTRMVQHVSRC